MTSVFRTTRRVEFADTDMAGIVHFANFFRFMEAAEHEFLRSRGLSVAMDWEGERIGFPASRRRATFRIPCASRTCWTSNSSWPGSAPNR